MPDAPTLGLALIARDEEAALPGLLASVEGAFDQVALADTGSTDGTVDAFEGWAAAEEDRQPGFASTVGRFEWCDDFAAARNFADGLLDTDWLAWADCDDWVVGADRLRGVVGDAPPEADVLRVYYANEAGDVWVPRRRLVRASPGDRWSGRLHEGVSTVLPAKEVPIIDAEVAHWRTRRSGHRASSLERNASILRHWMEDDPGDAVPLRMLAAQEVTSGDAVEGLSLVEEYVRRFREPVMTDHEAEMTAWALELLRELVENGPSDLPYVDRWPLHAPLVMALDCRPQGFESATRPTTGVIATPELVAA